MWLAAAVIVGAALLLFWNELTPSGSESSDLAATPAHPSWSSSATAAAVQSTAPSAPTTTPAAATTSELDRPTAPDATDGVTLPAAAATARYYFTDVFNYVKATGDVVPMRNWSDVSCSVCRLNMSNFVTMNASQGSFAGNYRARNVVVSAVSWTDQRTASVELSLTVGPYMFRPSTAKPAERIPMMTTTVRATLTLAGNGWMMYDWEQVE